MNIDLGWLITGKQAGSSIFPQPLVGHVVSEPQKEYCVDNRSEMAEIPEYNQEQGIGSRTFAKSWLNGKGLKPEYLKLLRVSGHAMEGVLKDGDVVMIDTSKKQPTEKTPFAIRLGGELLVKNIQRQGGGDLLLVSRNRDYRDIVISSQKPPSDFEIIGAVIWHEHSWI